MFSYLKNEFDPCLHGYFSYNAIRSKLKLSQLNGPLCKYQVNCFSLDFLQILCVYLTPLSLKKSWTFFLPSFLLIIDACIFYSFTLFFCHLLILFCDVSLYLLSIISIVCFHFFSLFQSEQVSLAILVHLKYFLFCSRLFKAFFINSIHTFIDMYLLVRWK